MVWNHGFFVWIHAFVYEFTPTKNRVFFDFIWIHTMRYRNEFMTASAFYLFLVGANSYTKAWIHKKTHDFIPWIHAANAFYLFLVGANACFFVWIHSIFREKYVLNSGMIHPLNYLIQWWNHRGFDFRPLYHRKIIWFGSIEYESDLV